MSIASFEGLELGAVAAAAGCWIELLSGLDYSVAAARAGEFLKRDARDFGVKRRDVFGTLGANQAKLVVGRLRRRVRGHSTHRNRFS
jgi:hypothetical protein